MSHNNHHNKNGQEPWDSFIKRTIDPELVEHRFPKKEISKFSHALSLSQLIQILPNVVNKYRQDCAHYREALIILYLIMVEKGCSSQTVIATAVEILFNLLEYRIILVCCREGKPTIA